MKREKINEREQFDFDDQIKILRKSDERCCHCGKKAFFGYEATVDHFIPLYKGGTNRMINLVMLCRDCNREKGSMIKDITYLPYLKTEYKQELKGYLDSYIRSFEYISRKQILALDEYNITLMPKQAVKGFRKSRRQGKPANGIGYKLNVKKAQVNDYDRICDYFIRYGKRYEIDQTDYDAKIQIFFWMQFGCIYYIEQNGSISAIYALTVQDTTGTFRQNTDVFANINVYAFSCYASDHAMKVVYNTIDYFVHTLANEQDLTVVPVIYRLHSKDRMALPLAKQMCHSFNTVFDSKKTEEYYTVKILYSIQKEEGRTEDDENEVERSRKFFASFKNQKEELKQYLIMYPDCKGLKERSAEILSVADFAEIEAAAKQALETDIVGQ